MKKKVKLKICGLFLSFEITVFMFVYFFGAYGVMVLSKIDRDNCFLEKEIIKIKKQNEVLEQEIVCWENDPFYKEKLAREVLQMGKKEEIVYFYE